MFSEIYKILVSILGESKQGGYDRNNEQYQFNCPCCADNNGGIVDGKFNLEVLLSYKGLKYNCWKCGEHDGTRGSISKLIKKYGSQSDYTNFINIMKSVYTSLLYDIDYFSKFVKQENEVEISLPKTFRKINLSEIKDNRLIKYLNKRRITQDIIDKFNIGFTSNYDDFTLRNRIIIPSYDRYGFLNFFVGRDFTGKNKMKYCNSKIPKDNIIFQEELINWDADIVLCEGAIDVLYLNNSISLLGKVLSKDSALYKSILNRSNAKVIICLDADTDIDEVKKIYKILSVGRLKGKIYYIRLTDKKDFGEVYEAYGKIGIIKELRKLKQFTEFELSI